jgi:hypothetical protein
MRWEQNEVLSKVEYTIYNDTVPNNQLFLH